MAAPWPDEVPLSGADWFLMAFDQAMRRANGRGNVGHLVVELDATVDVETLRAAVVEAPALAWLGSLRLARDGWWRRPRWRVLGPSRVAVEAHDGELEDVLQQALSAYDDPPVRIDVVGRLVVLSWHHALMSARGAETLVQHLGAGVDVMAPAPMATAAPLWRRLLSARLGRNFVFGISLGRIAEIGRGRVSAGAGIQHRRLRFDEDEVVRLNAAAAEAGAGPFRSLFLIGSVARALDSLLEGRGLPRRDMLVPMPQDRRRRGGDTSLVRNDLSVLFYRLKPADRRDPGAAVLALTTQMRALMAVHMPDHVQALLDFSRRLPLGLYLGLMSLPTWGRMATFGFSDTGATISQLRRFLGRDVVDAWHLPATFHPPGFQVVASRRGDTLELSTSWVEGVFSDQDYAGFEAALKRELLGEETSA